LPLTTPGWLTVELAVDQRVIDVDEPFSRTERVLDEFPA
jgi:hypothetical protein